MWVSAICTSLFSFYAEIRISSDWTVGTGENSKEVEIQRNRIRREKEIMYRIVAEIPSDPNEPWDREMDYDDTLTPVIPTEQLPDLDGAETPVVSPHKVEEIAVTSVNCTATTSQSSNGNGNVPEPDLELLAVLLKNPELVMALTSGQGGNLSSDETVKLLDMIKANGSVGSNLTAKPEENVEVSLPSPTPSSNTTVTVRVLSTYCTTFDNHYKNLHFLLHLLHGLLLDGLE